MRKDFIAVQYREKSIATVSKSRVVTVEKIALMHSEAKGRELKMKQHSSVIVTSKGHVVLTKEKRDNVYWLPGGKLDGSLKAN
jgi:hypothetical protein